MNLKKSYFWNTLGSGLNSFNSLFFLIIVTRINGVKEAGIFTFSFATACMFYIIAIYSGRTYQVTETQKNIDDNEFIVHRIICSLIMMIISFVFCFINGYSSFKFIVFILLCAFKCTEAISDVFHGIMQKNDRLDIVGKSLFFRSLMDLITFLIVDYFAKSVIIACIAMIIVNIIFLFLIDMRLGIHFKSKRVGLHRKDMITIFSLGFFTFGFTFIANYLVNAPRYSLDSIMGEKFQTIFGIIVMPATMIMLVNQFIIQPVIVTLKNSYSTKDKKKFLKIILKVVIGNLIVGLGSIIIAYFLGIPILNFMYHLELKEYLFDLLIILFGATLYTISCVLSNALIVLRKTKIQFGIYVIVSIFAYFISYELVKTFGFNGAIYSYLSIMASLLLLYIVYFIIIINKKEVWIMYEKKGKKQ